MCGGELLDENDGQQGAVTVETGRGGGTLEVPPRPLRQGLGAGRRGEEGSSGGGEGSGGGSFGPGGPVGWRGEEGRGGGEEEGGGDGGYGRDGRAGDALEDWRKGGGGGVKCHPSTQNVITIVTIIIIILSSYWSILTTEQTELRFQNDSLAG